MSYTFIVFLGCETVLDTESAFGKCLLNGGQMGECIPMRQAIQLTHQRALHFLQPHRGDLRPELTEIQPSHRGSYGCISGTSSPLQNPRVGVLVASASTAGPRAFHASCHHLVRGFSRGQESCMGHHGGTVVCVNAFWALHKNFFKSNEMW